MQGYASYHSCFAKDVKSEAMVIASSYGRISHHVFIIITQFVLGHFSMHMHTKGYRFGLSTYICVCLMTSILAL